MTSMASVPAQSLECGICHELYNEPKQLSCTHAFCQDCLDEHLEGDELTCPVCDETTPVEDGDISKLQTNFPIKSLVEDVKAAEKICTVCDHKLRAPPVAYCQACAEYMCSTCLDIHGKWKKNVGHEVVDSEAIKNGKVTVKQLCKKHPQEELEWACSTCKVSICFRCRMLYHNGDTHEVEEVAEFQKTLQDEAKTLQKDAGENIELIKAHTAFIEEQHVKTTSVLDERVVDVIRAFNEAVEKLTEQKDDFVKNLLHCKDELTGNLQELQESHQKLANDIAVTCDLMAKGIKGFLEGESLTVHQKLCEELQDLLDCVNCEEDNPQAITEQAENIKFTKYSEDEDEDELTFGEICNLPKLNDDDDDDASTNIDDKDWKLEKLDSFSVSGAGVADMAPTPDGRMAVGYKKGGIDLFTLEGLDDTVLEKTNITCLCVSSTSKFVIINESDGLSQYSSRFTKGSSMELSMKRKPGLCLGKKDEILVFQYMGSYRAVVTEYASGTYLSLSLNKGDEKEIHWTPERVQRMNHKSHIVLAYETSVQVHNEEYKCIYEVAISGTAHPVVLPDDSILIGVAKDGYATVELYTQDLRFVRTVLERFKLTGYAFFMESFSSGEIAICDSRAVHVFEKKW